MTRLKQSHQFLRLWGLVIRKLMQLQSHNPAFRATSYRLWGLVISKLMQLQSHNPAFRATSYWLWGFVISKLMHRQSPKPGFLFATSYRLRELVISKLIWL